MWVEGGGGGGGKRGGERGETFTKFGTWERGCESKYIAGEGEREREEELYYQRPNGKGLFVVRPIFCSDTGPDPFSIITVCLSSLSLCSRIAAGGSKSIIKSTIVSDHSAITTTAFNIPRRCRSDLVSVITLCLSSSSLSSYTVVKVDRS